jgi:NADH-quinone oxidoreductase subunit H
MFENLDQLFVALKHVLVRLAPPEWQAEAGALVSAAGILMTFATLFALTTWIERKALGRIQNRLGPNRTGPFGLLQPMADGIKMLTKEDIVPRGADKFVHFLAPVAMVVPLMLAYAVLPLGRNMVALELEAGLLFFFAVGSSTELALFMAGWASRNKFTLLGAMRAIAQMVSYELPLILSAASVVMLAGSLSLVRIVEAQSACHWGWLAQWNVFTPWGCCGLILFVIAATAESNRSPFDIPEGESELVAGHLVEYSGFKYALFFLGEYFGLFAVSGLAITLFLGGWLPPVSFLGWVPSYLWFFAKLLGFIALFVWLRGTMPRLRFDQLLRFAWTCLLPLALLNLLSAALWHYSRAWSVPGAGLFRWAVCAAIVLVPYYGIARRLCAGAGFGPRTYRFAA